MSGDSTSDGPIGDPFPKLNPPLRFSPRWPLMLHTLLAHHSYTRFGTHALKKAPRRESKRSLLLSICGYRVRRCDELLATRGASGLWIAVSPPIADEPMLDFLRHVCEHDWPALTMDANDERLEVVFSVSGRRTTRRSARE